MTSDLKSHGLRGPVKSCTEETAHPMMAPTGGSSQLLFNRTILYDRNGRIVTLRVHNSDGSEWAIHHEYSSSGQLLKISSGTAGSAPSITTHSYDEQGRLQQITTDDGKPPTSFRYDERGRKTASHVSRAEDYRPNVASSGSPFEVSDGPPNLPDGGTATTIYDDHDRPTEVQVRDASGDLVSRAVRAYDAAGRIVEEKQISEDVMAGFPVAVQKQMVEMHGLPADQVRRELQSQLAKMMGGSLETYTITYTYDSLGRIRHVSRRIYNHQDEIDTTYNDHGDAESEITRGTRLDPPNDPAAATSSYSEVRNSYRYDEHGNWTERTASYRSTAVSEFQTSTVVKRSLTYY